MLEKLRFVMVDDEPSLLESMEALLEHAGHNVTCFNDSQLALDYITQHHDNIDVLVSDFMMPNMDGKSLTEKVHKIVPSLPIFIMTGYADEHEEEAFLSAGAVAVFLKPTRANDILEKTREILPCT
ncbi:response regulator [Aestuariibacter salexigens]|uniref:response regulator n=1 Tax=Aestuariibacter salexigens TaxID=226010 RepID=UPI00047A04C6|nr:response regulator [Aestuariibacter salexigens]